jgi:hypothetical protein
MTELDNERRQQGTGILLFNVLEIEKEICQMSCSSTGDAFDILDDR